MSGAVASLTLFAGVAAAASVLSVAVAPVPVSTVPVPPAGAVAPDLLGDGEPVFVVAHRAQDGGGVSVVSAINPHLDIPVVWCASDRRFVEPGPASSFDEEGTYVNGPAPEGLVTFDVELDPSTPGLARVGARRPARGREQPALRPIGPSCEWDVTQDERVSVERIVGAVGHDLAALYGPATAPEAADRTSRRWARFTGRVSTDETGRSVVCSPREEPGCPRPSPPVVSLFAEDERRFRDGWSCVGDIDGEILAKVTPAGFVDVAVPPPFVGVGVAEGGEGEGYWAHSTQRCAHDDAGEGEAGQLSATLVAVGQIARDGRTVMVAVLDGPAQPMTLDAFPRPLRDVAPADRWEFAARAYIGDSAAPRSPEGRRLPKSTYLPEELPSLLAERGPLPIALHLDSGGRIIWGELVDTPAAPA